MSIYLIWFRLSICYLLGPYFTILLYTWIQFFLRKPWLHRCQYISHWIQSGPFPLCTVHPSLAVMPVFSPPNSHCVCHPVDHIDDGEGGWEHGPGVDIYGVCLERLTSATTLRTATTALLLLFSLYWCSGPTPPPMLHVLLAGGLGTGALWTAAGDHQALVHSGHRQGKEHHGLLPILHDRLKKNINRERLQVNSFVKHLYLTPKEPKGKLAC